MLPSPLDLLMLAGAGLVVVELAFVVKRHPPVGVWLLTAGAVLTTYRWPPAIIVAGYQVYLLDALIAIVLLAVVMALGAGKGLRPNAPLLLLLGLLGLALARGIASFGAQTTINASRSLLYVLLAALFVQVFGDGTWVTLQRAWRIAAVSLLAIAAVFWIRNGFGTYADGGGRALNSAQAMLVAQAGFMAMGDAHGRRARVFALVCMLAILASQQRTVWAASLLTALVLASRSGRAGSPSVRRALRGGLLAALLAVILLLTVGPGDLRESTTAAVAREGAISTDSGNFGWRVESWTYLLGEFESRPISDQMVGQPMGTSLERVVAEIVRTESPHNMYVMVIISLGYLGLAMMLWLIYRSLVRTRFSDPVLFAIVAGLCVYSIGYQLLPEHGLLLGAALTAGRRARHTSADKAEVPA